MRLLTRAACGMSSISSPAPWIIPKAKCILPVAGDVAANNAIVWRCSLSLYPADRDHSSIGDEPLPFAPLLPSCLGLLSPSRSLPLLTHPGSSPSPSAGNVSPPSPSLSPQRSMPKKLHSGDKKRRRGRGRQPGAPSCGREREVQRAAAHWRSLLIMIQYRAVTPLTSSPGYGGSPPSRETRCLIWRFMCTRNITRLALHLIDFPARNVTLYSRTTSC